MEKDNIFKDIWKVLHSMKFGIILLVIIGISSIAGTLIPQDNIIGFYESTYSPAVFKMIKTLSLHKVYSSWWFIIMIGLLSINLILCSIKRLPTIIKRIKKKPNLEQEVNRKSSLFKRKTHKEIDVGEFFNKSGFKEIEEMENEDGVLYYSKRNFIGYIGSWLTHVGLFIIILSYATGKIAGFEAFVHGVPGSLQPIEGTDYWIEIEDFNIEFREDHTVEQYISQVKVTDMEGDYSQRGSVRVNHPFRAEKMNIYQNGTGWALDVGIKKNGEEISSKTLYQSEVYVEDDKNIALQFVNFYPDFDDSGGHLHTLTPYLNNPKLLYSVFYGGQMVDMNIIGMGEEITWEEYSIHVDNPQMFTLLQVGRDPGMKTAALGGATLILGIFLAFYIHPRELIGFKYKNGETEIWGRCSTKDEIFREKMEEALNEIMGEEN